MCGKGEQPVYIPAGDGVYQKALKNLAGDKTKKMG